MFSAILQAFLGAALMVFVIARYLNIPQLAPAKKIWLGLEQRFNFAKKWWFKLLLVLIAIGGLGQISQQLEAQKYGVDRSEMSSLQSAAKDNNMELRDYIVADKEAKAQNFSTTKNYLLAKKNGFSNAADWGDAKKLKIENFSAYESAMKDMQQRGISGVDDYIAKLKEEAKANANAKAKAEEDANAKAAERERIPTLDRYSYRKTGNAGSNNITPAQYKNICSKTSSYVDPDELRSTFGFNSDPKISALWENMGRAAFTVNDVYWGASSELCLVGITASGTVKGDSVFKKFICVIDSFKPAKKDLYYAGGIQYCDN